MAKRRNRGDGSLHLRKDGRWEGRYVVGYDDKGLPITGLEEFDKHDGYYCFHAGTKFDGDQIVTNGGRVLGVTAKGKDLKEARANAYAATEWVKFDNKYMRHDIGKAIDEAQKIRDDFRMIKEKVHFKFGILEMYLLFLVVGSTPVWSTFFCCSPKGKVI